MLLYSVAPLSISHIWQMTLHFTFTFTAVPGGGGKVGISCSFLQYVYLRTFVKAFIEKSVREHAIF